MRPKQQPCCKRAILVGRPLYGLLPWAQDETWYGLQIAVDENNQQLGTATKDVVLLTFAR